MLHRDTSARRDVVIVGSGTLGAIIYDCLDGDELWTAVGFVDDTKPGSSLFGLPVHGSASGALEPGTAAIIAVAAPAGRRSFVEELEPLGLDWVSFADRRSHVSRLAELGRGAVVLPFATVGPLTRIGRFGYIGAYAAVGNGAEIGDYASLMARASAGACKIGDGCQIGFNSACLDGAVLGDDVVLAPYTWVRKPVQSSCFVTGNPAISRPLSTINRGATPH